MKNIKKVILVLLIGFVIAQFFGPEKNEGELASMDAFMAETNPPEDVKIILKEACIDCHSDVTEYPWYNNITPVNYWLASHVKDGKKHFNLSNWEGNSVKRKDHKFEEIRWYTRISKCYEKHLTYYWFCVARAKKFCCW